ncbi:hypothetical protein V866_007531 [Kwoniella sp. B9012]
MSAATETQQIVGAFNSLSIRDAKDDLAHCVPRPDFGRQGRRITVTANMFPVTFKKSDMIVYHYDIDIDIPSTIRSRDSTGGQKQYKELKWKIWKELCATAPEGAIKEGLAGAAFDRERNFYATVKLPLSRTVANLKVELKDEEGQAPTQRGRQTRVFNVKVQFAREIDLNVILSYCQGQAFDPETRDMVAMGKAAINTLLRQDLYDRFDIKGGQGKRFFTLDDARFSLTPPTVLSFALEIYSKSSPKFSWTMVMVEVEEVAEVAESRTIGEVVSGSEIHTDLPRNSTTS